MMDFVRAYGLQSLVAFLSLGAVAVIGGLLTEVGPWYERLRFPKLRPPNWLFGPAWTTIYVLIGIGAVLAWDEARDSGTRRLLVLLLVVNGALNILWSPLFFKFKRPDWALIEVAPFWLSIVALIACLYAIKPLAAWIVSPYLVWVTFAAWLNWRIVELNKPFGGAGTRR